MNNAASMNAREAGHLRRLRRRKATEARRRTFGLQVIHMPNIGAGGKGGVTVAYRPTKEWARSRILEVSTAICHQTDAYDKVEGAYIACRSFADGYRIRVRVPRNVTKIEALKVMFALSAIDALVGIDE